MPAWWSDRTMPWPSSAKIFRTQSGKACSRVSRPDGRTSSRRTCGWPSRFLPRAVHASAVPRGCPPGADRSCRLRRADPRHRPSDRPGSLAVRRRPRRGPRAEDPQHAGQDRSTDRLCVGPQPCWVECQTVSDFDPEPGNPAGARWYQVRWPTATPNTEPNVSGPADPATGWAYSAYLAPVGTDGDVPACPAAAG